MHIVSIKKYKPPFYYRNGHVHTIGSALFRKSTFCFTERERLELADSDFLDLDWYKNNKLKCLVLVHGLEGSSQSSYILSAANRFSAEGYDICAMNLRSCSGEMNRLPRMYHHGEIEDLGLVINKVSSMYREVFLMGFSLGGNQVLKYLSCSQTIPANFQKGVAVSPPIHLESCVQEIHKPINRLYHQRFLKTLLKKMAIKADQIPNFDKEKKRERVKTIREFDDAFTAPIHGFRSGADYYEKASALQDLPHLQKPVLLITSKDDPMLGPDCYLDQLVSNNLYYLETKYGGHVGFFHNKHEGYLYENITDKWFNDELL